MHTEASLSIATKPTTTAISVRRGRSGTEDATSLAALINRAYAVEGFFVDGDRTNALEIEKLLRGDGTFLVLETQHEHQLAAAVYVSFGADGGYIGMLSVEPDLQGMGLGTRLVRIAEALCEAMGVSRVRLRIVNLREELARWYRSLGYREVGTAPYDHRSVKQACHFVDMAKTLSLPATEVTSSDLGHLGSAIL